jgi:phosphoserine aminotransferase
MTRGFNFSAGPAMLPTEVLQQAAEEMLDWHGTGISVMEMSHRSAAFEEIYFQTHNALRALLAVPSEYEILFAAGGARTQNSLVPMNLIDRCNQNQPQADYLVTGAWSEKSWQEAQKYGQIQLVASTEPTGFTSIPALDTWRCTPEAAYLHLCSNETIHGVELNHLPELDTIFVADMSSQLLSRPIDVSQFGVIYACAQKNMGISGLTIVIVRHDLLDYASPLTPSTLHWKTLAASQSMYNTPPNYAIYITGLVLAWLQSQGGLELMAQRNQAKAECLYQAIDRSDFYSNHVEPDARSRMNIPFFLARPELGSEFLRGAEARRLLHLKGHKNLGGMRASLYNAMPIEGVHALVEYMRDFERLHA